MTTRKFVASLLAAAFFCAPLAAQAATAKHVRTHSHGMHMVKNGHGTARGSTASADHSADALNAQSLQRSQTGQ